MTSANQISIVLASEIGFWPTDLDSSSSLGPDIYSGPKVPDGTLLLRSPVSNIRPFLPPHGYSLLEACDTLATHLFSISVFLGNKTSRYCRYR